MWTKEETCVGPIVDTNREKWFWNHTICMAAELCEMERLALPRDLGGHAVAGEELTAWVMKWFSKKPRGNDSDGFYFCGFCNKPRRDQLIQCPSCKKYFKGPRPFFPADYECENCE